MADKFRVGDVVKLKSGGPNMTVEETYPDKVGTSWFDTNGKRHGWIFRADAIEHALKVIDHD